MSTSQENDGLAEKLELGVGSESRQLFDKLAARWREIVAAAAGILVLVALYGGYNAYQARQLTQAEEALNKAVLENHGAERLALLQTLEQSLPKALLPRVRLETAQAAQEQGDWTKALDSWKRLAESGPEQWKTLARLGISAALLELNRPQEALAELDALRARAGDDLLITIMLQQAEAAEMAEDWERALALYEELKAKEGSAQPGYIDFKINELRDNLAARQS